MHCKCTLCTQAHPSMYLDLEKFFSSDLISHVQKVYTMYSSTPSHCTWILRSSSAVISSALFSKIRTCQRYFIFLTYFISEGREVIRLITQGYATILIGRNFLLAIYLFIFRIYIRKIQDVLYELEKIT